MALLGAANYFLVLRGRVEGIYLGLLNQATWTTYALATKQYGFLFSAALFATINIQGLRNYMKARDKNEDD